MLNISAACSRHSFFHVFLCDNIQQSDLVLQQSRGSRNGPSGSARYFADALSFRSFLYRQIKKDELNTLQVMKNTHSSVPKKPKS